MRVVVLLLVLVGIIVSATYDTQYLLSVLWIVASPIAVVYVFWEIGKDLCGIHAFGRNKVAFYHWMGFRPTLLLRTRPWRFTIVASSCSFMRARTFSRSTKNDVQVSLKKLSPATIQMPTRNTEARKKGGPHVVQEAFLSHVPRFDENTIEACETWKKVQIRLCTYTPTMTIKELSGSSIFFLHQFQRCFTTTTCV